MTPETRDEYGFGPLSDDGMDVARMTLHKLLAMLAEKVTKNGPSGEKVFPRVNTVGRRLYALMFAVTPELLEGRSLRDLAGEFGVTYQAMSQALNDLRDKGYRCERMRSDSQRAAFKRNARAMPAK